MSDWLDEYRNRRDGVTVPTIWVAIALSLLIHAAVLWGWMPRIRLPLLEEPERNEIRGPLVVHLAPPLGPPGPTASPALQVRPPKAAARPGSTPPVIALNRPAPDTSSPARTAPSVPPTPARPAAEGDLSSYIEARRRARAEAQPDASPGSVSNAPPAEDDNARSNRIAAANLGSQRKMTFGYDPNRGGGTFQIQRIGYDDAEFLFYGWNREIRRYTKQLIEVRKGSNSDIRIAVVRKMIAIIREYEQGDFLWESRRLGRDLMLSARPRDNAGLEDFMMREFFTEAPLPQ
jgi:hypothetical protein